MRKLLILTSAIVFFDTLFFAALTPLLPHYAHTLGLGKAGAGVLAAAYPAGALAGAIPSGIVAARFGVKPTVLVGLIAVGVCTVALRHRGARAGRSTLARFCQGLRQLVLVDGRARVARRRRPGGPARHADRRRLRDRGRRRAARAGARRNRRARGDRLDVRRRRRRVVRARGVGRRDARRRRRAGRSRSACSRARSATAQMLGAYWFVVLPALLFGVLSVLAPLRLSALGFGSVAIGAVFLCAAAFEVVNNLVVGRLSDRRGPLYPIGISLAASIVVAAVLPWPNERFALAALVVCASLSFGTFFTPGMTLLTNLSEAARSRLRLHVRARQPRLGAGPDARRGRRRRARPRHGRRRALPRCCRRSAPLTLVGLRRSG